MTSKKTILPSILLAAFVTCGCSDSDRVVLPAAPVLDTAPPTVPTGLSASTGARLVKLSWESNTTDADLTGYLVYRLAFGNSYRQTERPIRETMYLDTHPLDTACRYAISAVDEAGNESAWTEVCYVPVPPSPEPERVP